MRREHRIYRLRQTPLLLLFFYDGSAHLGEHAYYLDYQNKKGDFVDAFWNIIDWDTVERRFRAAAA